MKKFFHILYIICIVSLLIIIVYQSNRCTELNKEKVNSFKIDRLKSEESIIKAVFILEEFRRLGLEEQKIIRREIDLLTELFFYQRSSKEMIPEAAEYCERYNISINDLGINLN
jgi:hypothetical protein